MFSSPLWFELTCHGSHIDPWGAMMMRRWIVTNVLLLVAVIIAGCGTAIPTMPPTKARNAGNAAIALRPTQTVTLASTPSIVATTSVPRPSPIPTSTPTPLPTIAPEFWVAVGVAPDTLIALQTSTSSQELGDIAVMSVDGTHYQQLTNYGYNRDPRL